MPQLKYIKSPADLELVTDSFGRATCRIYEICGGKPMNEAALFIEKGVYIAGSQGLILGSGRHFGYYPVGEGIERIMAHYKKARKMLLGRAQYES